ncbi:hypothetical protein KVP09_01440 [Alcaligenaceae bacterium CGII-47]|nr:hypothetical protein [Alcaligenaceae bacterium CGII-47]
MREPLILNVKGVELAFGLDWLPLVGADPMRLARERVRQHGATHSVMSGAAGAAVGLAWLGSSRIRQSPPCSGAQVFALLHPGGTVATVLDLGVHGWCTLAAHEGAILARADKVYADRSLADGVLNDIRQAYPSVHVLGGVDATEPGPSLTSLAAATVQTVAQRARLMRAPRVWWRRPVIWTALSLSLAVLALQRVTVYSQAAEQAAGLPDLDGAWSQAQAAVLRGHRLHGEAGTRGLLGAFYTLPVSLAGWRLVQVSCATQAALWVCKAEYVRAGAIADNQGLLRAARSDWRLDFPTIDRAWAHWSSGLVSLALDQHTVPSPADHNKDWVSALQAIQNAFSKVHIEPSRALVIPAPLGADQQPLPQPTHLHRYSTRNVQLVGPLRSANLLIPLAEHIAWTKAVLSVDHTLTLGIAQNPLNLTLDGVLYEMEVPKDPRA